MFFSVLVLSLALMACGKGNTPDPEPTPDPTPVTYEKANTHVVYECNERLFSKQNAFQTIEAYLPTLQAMQVDVLWLMPIHPRGTVKSCNSPYCVKDYKAIDPAFGTLDDLKTLVTDCHNRGMLVMLDWIANHTAWDNQWYLDHPEWYTTPTGDETNWSDVVPLDFSKQVVCDTMQDAMLYWVREADIDGFRCDYAHGVPTSFWKSAITEMRKLKPGLIMLAETSKTDYYDAGFDWLYSWSYLSAVQSIYSKNVSNLFSTSAAEFANTPSGKDRLRYTTTHDATSENAPSKWYKSADGELAAACLTYFLGGVPMIYSSQEIGDISQISFFNYKLLDFTSANSTLEKYKALMTAYINTAEARYGEVNNLTTASNVAMFTRTQDDKKLLVIVNASAEEQSQLLPAEWQFETVTDQLTGQTQSVSKTITLPAYGYAVYTR